MRYQFSALAESLNLTGSVIDSWLPNSLVESNQGAAWVDDTNFIDPYVEFSDSNLGGFRVQLDYVPPQTSLDYLPDGAGGQNPSGGFTCTGLGRLSNGNWIIGNDGRTDEADVTHDCSVVILSSDKTTIVDEWDMTPVSLVGNNSVQGVTVHTDGTIYVASPQANKILHLSSTGSKLGEIAATGANGLAYNPDDNQLLWKSNLNDGILHVYDLDTSSEVDTWSISLNIDHLYYSQGALWCTDGANGTDATIFIYDTITHELIGRLLNFVDAQAVEGIYVSGNKLTISNDGGFHAASTPARNMLLEYEVDTTAYPARTRFLGVHSRLKLNGASPSNKGVLISRGKPNTTGKTGWALYDIPNDRIRLQVREDAAFWLIEFDVTRGVDFDFSVYVDFDGEVAYGEINGVPTAPFRIAGDYTNIPTHLNITNMRLGRGNEAGGNEFTINASVKTIAVTSTLSEFNAQAILIQSDPVISSTSTLTIMGIPDGTFLTTLLTDARPSLLIESVDRTYSSGETSFLIDQPVGTQIYGVVRDGSDPSTDGAAIKAITT